MTRRKYTPADMAAVSDNPELTREEIAAARERDQLGDVDRLGPGAELAGEPQARMVVDPALGVAHEQAHGLARARRGARRHGWGVTNRVGSRPAPNTLAPSQRNKMND